MIRWIFFLLICPCAKGELNAEQNGVLRRHNYYRCRAGLAEIKWDESLLKSLTATETETDVEPPRNLAHSDSLVVHAETVVDPWFSGDAAHAEGVSDIKSVTSVGCHITTNPGLKIQCAYKTVGEGTEANPPETVTPRANEECKKEEIDQRNNKMQPIPSYCSPSVPLPDGSPCVFGFQCESRECSSTHKVCGSGVDGHQAGFATVFDEVLRQNPLLKEVEELLNNPVCQPTEMRACSEKPLWADGSGGDWPFSEANLENCGCNDKFIEMYRKNTWVNMYQTVKPEFKCEDKVNVDEENGDDNKPEDQPLPPSKDPPLPPSKDPQTEPTESQDPPLPPSKDPQTEPTESQEYSEDPEDSEEDDGSSMLKIIFIIGGAVLVSLALIALGVVVWRSRAYKTATTVATQDQGLSERSPSIFGGKHDAMIQHAIQIVESDRRRAIAKKPIK